MTADRIGTSSTEFAELRANDRTYRVPVITEQHKRTMVADLYQCGWSYRLIAQALSMDPDEVVQVMYDQG
jgi:hypothetical protein